MTVSIPSYHTLRFDPHVAHTAHNVVARLQTVFQGYHFNRIGRVMRTQDQVTVSTFDILIVQVQPLRTAYMLLSPFRYGVSEL